MKKSGFFPMIILVSLVPMAIVLPLAETADAWGLTTHMFIVSEAMDQLTNESWAEVFDYYAPEILQGSTTPDQAWQDWENHLYYPHNGNNTAPQAAQRWFEFSRDNLTSGNWEEAFFAMGVMSHYFADPCIPVHTDAWWPGHVGYESDINSNLAVLELTDGSESIISNVSQLVVDCATYSHQYYDDVYAAYENETSEAIETDSTIRELTEDCLSLAINGCLSLFYTLTTYTDAPTITITYDYVALFDFAHSNDYTDYSGESRLTSINLTLVRNHFEMKQQETAFTPADLADVDLLVITCALDSYTSSELSAITDWASGENKTLILTGRGDFSEYVNPVSPNAILEAVGSHIRVNHDNVYMSGTYQPWYNDLTIIPDPSETVGLTASITTITMYSPLSLYFTDDGPVLPIIYGDPSAYQVENLGPDAEVIYDDTNDGVNGDQIPLMAGEEIGSLRVFVAGTTFFSDFDYGRATLFDNVLLMENILEWASNREAGFVPDVDEIGPRIGNLSQNLIYYTDTTQVDVEFSVIVTDPSGVQSVSLVHPGGIDSMTADGDTYNLTLTDVPDTFEVDIIATDTEGNEAFRGSFDIDIVASTITSPTTSPTTGPPTPADLTLPLIIGGVVVLALVVIVVLKRR